MRCQVCHRVLDALVYDDTASPAYWRGRTVKDRPAGIIHRSEMGFELFDALRDDEVAAYRCHRRCGRVVFCTYGEIVARCRDAAPNGDFEV